MVIFLCYFTLIINVNAQTVKKYIGDFTGKETEGKAEYEYYEKDFKKYFHGKFNYTFYQNNVKFTISGTFKNNLRNGLWTINGSILKPIGNIVYGEYLLTGEYTNGELIGKWTYKQIFKEKYSGGVSTVSSYSTANFRNNHFVGKIYSMFKNDNVLTAELNGQFNDNGFMTGLWSIKYPKYTSSFEDAKNSPIIEDIRNYQNGLCFSMKIMDISNNELIENNDNSDFLNLFMQHIDTMSNICGYSNKIYSLKENQTGKIIYGIAKSNNHIDDVLNFWSSNSKENLLGEVTTDFNIPNSIVEKQVIDIGTPISIYEKATKYFNSGNLENALKYISSVVNSEPSNTLYLGTYGWWLLLDKQYLKSLQVFERANSLSEKTKQDTMIYLCRLAHAYLLNNQYDKALQIYNENLDKKINNLDCYDFINNDFNLLLNHGITTTDIVKMKNVLSLKKEQIENTQKKLNQLKEKEKIINEMKKNSETIKTEKEKLQSSSKKIGKKIFLTLNSFYENQLLQEKDTFKIVEIQKNIIQSYDLINKHCIQNDPLPVVIKQFKVSETPEEYLKVLYSIDKINADNKQNYNLAIEKADKFLLEKKYRNAKIEYKKALSYIKNDQYATQKKKTAKRLQTKVVIVKIAYTAGIAIVVYLAVAESVK